LVGEGYAQRRANPAGDHSQGGTYLQSEGLRRGGFVRPHASDRLRERRDFTAIFESKEQLAAEAFDYAWKLAIDTRFEGTQDVPNAVDRLKLFVRNFRDRRARLVPGGCPLLNTAIDSDDAHPPLRRKARRALDYWLDRLQAIAEEGKRRGEVRSAVDSVELATLIVNSLEGGWWLAGCNAGTTPLIWLAVTWRNISKRVFVRRNQRSGGKSHECFGDSVKADFRTRAKTNDVPVARLIGI